MSPIIAQLNVCVKKKERKREKNKKFTFLNSFFLTTPKIATKKLALYCQRIAMGLTMLPENKKIKPTVKIVKRVTYYNVCNH